MHSFTRLIGSTITDHCVNWQTASGSRKLTTSRLSSCTGDCYANFAEGETRYYDQAQQQIKNITEPALWRWRFECIPSVPKFSFHSMPATSPRVTFALYKVDLPRDVRFTKSSTDEDGDAEEGGASWIQRLSLVGRAPVKQWSKDLPDKGEHRPFSEWCASMASCQLELMYSMRRVRAINARDLVLVTDASIVMKTSSKQVLVYFAHALSGAPIANSTLLCGKITTQTTDGVGASCNRTPTATESQSSR
jgi:hypothetical protein